MVDACASAGILPFYGPFGDIKDTAGCETQFRAAFLLGCVGAWSLHPVQIEIAKKVFSPPPDEVKFAKKVLEAIPDGAGVHMIDGKMQDDATWKQCKVMVELAEMLAEKDPELAEAYEPVVAPLGAGCAHNRRQCVGEPQCWLRRLSSLYSPPQPQPKLATSPKGVSTPLAAPTRGSPCATITYAVGQANGGDTIQIGPGTFVESVPTDKVLTFVGAGGGTLDGIPAVTVIQGACRNNGHRRHRAGIAERGHGEIAPGRGRQRRQRDPDIRRTRW